MPSEEASERIKSSATFTRLHYSFSVISDFEAEKREGIFKMNWTDCKLSESCKLQEAHKNFSGKS